jgi:integrase
MYDNLYSDNNVFNQGTICACFLAYAAFRRASELLSLRRCDIEFFPSHMSVFIQKSKTDIHRERNPLLLQEHELICV